MLVHLQLVVASWFFFFHKAQHYGTYITVRTPVQGGNVCDNHVINSFSVAKNVGICRNIVRKYTSIINYSGRPTWNNSVDDRIASPSNVRNEHWASEKGLCGTLTACLNCRSGNTWNKFSFKFNGRNSCSMLSIITSI